MKLRTIISLMSLTLAATGVQAKIVPSAAEKVGEKTYYWYPNGVLPDAVPSPAYRLEANDGRYMAGIAKVAVLCGNRPDVNFTSIDSDFAVPEFIEAQGSLYPVTAVEGAFVNSKAKNVALHDNISRIGAYTFDGASGVTSLTLPAALKYIGRDAFRKMENLERVYMRSFLPPVCEVADGNKTVTVSLTENRDIQISDAAPLFGLRTVVNVPKGSLWFYRQHPCFAGLRLVEYTPEYGKPTLSGDNAADGFTIGYAGSGALIVTVANGGDMVLIPSRLESDDYQMGISMTEKPYEVKYISGKILDGKNLVTTLSIPGTVEAIGSEAFRGTRPASLAIPEGVGYIGPKAFASITTLRRLIVNRPADGPELVCAPDAFSGSAENATLYIDKKSVDVTQAPWNEFKDIRDISTLQ